MSALRVYVAGAWVEQHQRARPMIARLRAVGCVITCDWTKEESDVCACGHHRQEHAPYVTSAGDDRLGCSHEPTPGVGFDCPCESFNGIGSGGDSTLTDEARKKYALADLDGVLSADVVLLLAANDQGACGSWVELGAALAVAYHHHLAKTLYIIVAGPKNKRTIFTELADALVADDEAGFRAVVARQVAKAGGLTLPGWTCSACGTFNGSAKEVRVNCRGCGAPGVSSAPEVP